MKIKLLSTDFDGTLVDHFSRPAVAPELFERLAELRREGALWAINTGRALDHIIYGLDEFGFPFEPDFVLTSERDVFRPKPGGGWEDFGDWNAKCAQAHEELFAQAGPLLGEIVSFVERETQAQAIYENERMIGLATTSEEEMDVVVEFLERSRERLPQFSFQRNTIYVRFCHARYSKGAALSELARLTGIGREAIFAAGDHHNDIPMLDGEHARWVMCPGNAVAAVKEVVDRAGGYVAQGTCSAGVVEALDHFAGAPF